MRLIAVFLVASVTLSFCPFTYAGLRFGGETLREKIIELNTVGGGGGEALPCPAAANTGEIHYTDLTETFDCDGDEGLTFTESTNLVNINEATDGDSILLRLDNDLASDGNLNETAQIRFGFGTDTDVARMIVGKIGGYTGAATNSDSFIAFNVDADNVSREVMRIAGLIDSPASLANLGVAIGATDTSLAALYIEPFASGSTDRGLLVRDYPGTLDMLQTLGDNSVVVGDVDHTGSVGITVYSGGRASIALQGTQSFNSPAAVQLTTSTSPTFTSEIGILDVASPTFQRYAQWDNSNISGIQAESPFVLFNPTPVQSVGVATGTTVTNQRAFIFNAQTINGVAGGGTETVTNAATVYIDAAPSGSDITFTNGPYALWVDAGAVRFDGTVTYNSSQTATGDITIQKADPTLIYDVTTATDTDFWAGVQDDAGSDDDDTYQIGKGTTPGTTPRFTMTGAGAISLVDKLTTYNNIATVGNGVPSELATIDTTGLTDNVAASTLYAVPASGEGMYRVSAYVVLTTAASLSSTLPNVQIVYTDKDSNTSVTLDATPVLGAAGLGQTGALTANTVGTVDAGVVPIYVKASTTIQYKTVNYASNLAGMAYALHIKLEAM